MFRFLRSILSSNDDVLLVHTRVHSSSVIWSVENPSDFLQAVSFGLGEQEPGRGEDDDQQDAKNDVIVPADVVQRNGIDECQNNQRAIDGDHLDCQALCSQTEGEDLGWVSGETISFITSTISANLPKQERRVCDVVVEVIHENEHNDCQSCSMRARGIEDSGAGSPDDKRD